jgi:mono/diheme cytochrome c family protein
VFSADRSTPRVALACAAALVLACGMVAAAQPTSVWSGVYTAEQASAGEKVYFDRCASCHGDDLGGRERAPALAGASFLDAWHGKHLRRLLERIEEMPPGAPVTSVEALDVLAFLLSTSDMPAGSTALPSDRARLAEITFERAKP